MKVLRPPIRVLIAAALIVVGLGLRVHAQHAADAVRLSEEQRDAVRALVGERENLPAWVAHGGLSASAMGAAIEATVRKAGIASSNVSELSAVESNDTAASGMVYRLDLKDVRAEAVVKLVYALEVEDGLRVVQLGLTRQDGPKALWRCELRIAASM